MKKTKCDGEFPCKRCKDDGLVCTAGTRKKTEYKQIPKGYAEVLENTQFALIATVHKLYAMVRTSQQWELGEPELNDRGQPVIHDIASMLGCIRPNSDIDLPVHSVFPEDEAGLAELARQLEEQQQMEGAIATRQQSSMSSSSRQIAGSGVGDGYSQTDRASSSELEPSDFEHDYRRAVFGSTGTAATASPQSLTYNDFDVASTATPPDTFADQSPAGAALASAYSSWLGRPQPAAATSAMAFAQRFAALSSPSSLAPYMDLDMLNQGLLESNFGTIKPHVVSCPNPEVMMGVGDPMIFSGYDPEVMET